MKKLICLEDVMDVINTGSLSMTINDNTIITPSAKDAAKEHGLVFTKENIVSCSATNQGIDAGMIYNVLTTLKQKGMLEQFQTMLSNIVDVPFKQQQDESGVRVVQGNTIELEKYDTANQASKVYCRQVTGHESPLQAGIWTFEGTGYLHQPETDETHHVIEGNIRVSVNGKTFTATQGDIICLPANCKVAFASSGKVKLFYAHNS